jgi:hypothetical protein
MSTKVNVMGFGLLLLGVGLLGATVYTAPMDAYDIQAPFKAHGEKVTGTVVEKSTVTRKFIGGGRRGKGEHSWEEPAVKVKVKGRTVRIKHLVLQSDFDALSEGDEVSVTLVRGKAAREALPKGPYYLLSSSVDAGPTQLLGWAFSGRPAHPAAIGTGIGGLV